MIQDTWKNFELSGKVSDYLAYRQGTCQRERLEKETEPLLSERGIDSYGTEHSSDRNGIERHAHW